MTYNNYLCDQKENLKNIWDGLFKLPLENESHVCCFDFVYGRWYNRLQKKLIKNIETKVLGSKATSIFTAWW